jgi:putative ABC transport system ATP-binding protein
MLHKGEIVLDVRDHEKKNLTIENILEKFEYAI